MNESEAVRPVIVLGISGATWRVIDPLIEAGRLPHFRRLKEEGASGTLRSIRVANDKHFRPQTAWPTLATGVRPERHGVTKFYDTAEDLKAPTLWDVYQEHGMRVGLYGWPVTWPPSETDGFVVPSHLARDARTWPPELEPIKLLDRQQQNAEREGGGGLSLGRHWATAKFFLRNGLRPAAMARLGIAAAKLVTTRDAEARSLVLRHAKLDLSADLFLSLYRREGPKFAAFTTFLVDLVSHRYWRYHEPSKFASAGEAEKVYAGAIAEAYAHVDEILGRMMEVAPRDAVIAVVSEHGMDAEPESTELGTWRYVIRGEQLRSFVGLPASIEPCPVARWVAFRTGTTDREVQADVARRMREVTVVETGQPLFQVHLHGADEVIVKFDIRREHPVYAAGDLEKLTVRHGEQTRPFLDIARRLGRQRSAMHDGDGIMLIRGPGIRPAGDLPEASVLDFMPTILASSGLPVPANLDGRTLEIFA